MRCVHLDFHTSPAIDGIGEKFNKTNFTETLKRAKIELMTVFAKCHHGYSYYPTKLGTMHPGLKFNLLKEEIEAIHEAGAKAPIYIPIGWSKKDADDHPEWCQVDFKTGKTAYMGTIPTGNPEAPFGNCSWCELCPNGPYLDYLEAITREICESFDVSDGIFYDICTRGDACACASCREGMKKAGLNPESYEDAVKYNKDSRVRMMKRLTKTVHEYAPNAPVFYNGSANMARPELHPLQTHFELEDLPTAWGGYDFMPQRAKFFEKYGKLYLGMTGKFHRDWGEFGGFKNKEALRYECADMLSVGASISVGDHLHPSGEIDASTYEIIGHAFDYVSKIDKYSENTRAYTDIAIWQSGSSGADLGASKLLQLMHLDFDIVTREESLDRYKCLILPDRVKLTAEDKSKIKGFCDAGGAIVASYESAFSELGIEKLEASEYDLDFIKCPFDEITTPFLSYSSAYKVRHSGEALAEVYEPYFNRTEGHFCGHKNTPYRPEPASYPALVKCGKVIYFAHPVFEAYNASGSYALERYIMKGIDEVYDRIISAEELPSTARVRVREEKGGEFIAMHLLYAPPINRGNVCLLPDFPKLHDVKITLKTNRKISSAISEPDKENVRFTQNGNEITIYVPPFSLHKLIILK